MKKDCDFVESFLPLEMDLHRINFWQKYIYLDLESFTSNIIVEKILHHLIHHGRPTAPDLMQIKDTPPQSGGQWSLPSITLLLVNYFILLFLLSSNLNATHAIQGCTKDGSFSSTSSRQMKSRKVIRVACQFLTGISSCPSSVILPVTSGYFSRSSSPYFRVMLVVSIPAVSTSHRVVIKLSMVNSDCLLCFS